MGTHVRILPIAISYGNLNIRIGEKQPEPTGRRPGQPAGRGQIDQLEAEETANVILFKGGVDIKEVVDGLNKIGISNSDLIEVLKTIKSAGALQAELIIK